MKDFKKEWAKLLAHAMEHADGISLFAWRVLLGIALLVVAVRASPEVGPLLLWAALKVPGLSP